MELRVYVPEHRPERGNPRTRVLQAKHDHPTAGYFGYKHYSYYVATTFGPHALAHSAPERPWHSISMDFIQQLHASNGFTAIWVVIDRLSKEDVFLPTTDTLTAPDVADAFVSHVFSKHGIPLHVSFDRGSEFTSHFFY